MNTTQNNVGFAIAQLQVALSLLENASRRETREEVNEILVQALVEVAQALDTANSIVKVQFRANARLLK